MRHCLVRTCANYESLFIQCIFFFGGGEFSPQKTYSSHRTAARLYALIDVFGRDTKLQKKHHGNRTPYFWTVACIVAGSVAEWWACWTQAQKGPGSNRSRDAVRNSLWQTVHTHCASVFTKKQNW